MARATPSKPTGAAALRKALAAATTTARTTTPAPAREGDGAKRAVRFPNPAGALRQHVASVEAPRPVRIRTPASPSGTLLAPPDSRARQIVRDLQTHSTRREADAIDASSRSSAPTHVSSGTFDNPSSLGSQVRALRRARDLTQEQLAIIAGVGRRFVIDLEGGKATAELGLVLQVLRALGCSLRLETTTDG